MIPKYLFSISLRSFRPPHLPDDVSMPLYLNLYKPDSKHIGRHVHRLKVDKVQKGGCTYLFTNDKVGLAIGVKGSCYNSGAVVAKKTTSIGFGNLVLVQSELDHRQTAQVISGIIQANYQFKVKGEMANEKEQVEESEGRYSSIQYLHVSEELYENKYLQELVKLANYKLYARDLANMRQEGIPTRFIQEVHNVFKNNKHVTIKVLEGEQLKQEGLNLFYAVGKGSIHPSALINLTYKGDPNNSEMIALVGKGITFDTGGLHLKSYGNMEVMHLDKSGACNVLAAFRGAVEMGLKINLTATLGMAENALSNMSYKPSDIITSHKGLTVEINNTDAEGRLVLADCLSWTQKTYNPKIIIEMSTLTGACAAALGENTAGIMSNSDSLVKELIHAGEEMQEPLWRLPVTQEHRDMMKGQFADLCNIGKSKVCGASKAAAFLFNFIDENTEYAHIDIAGPMESKTDKNLNPAGATGFGSQIILKYLLQKQSKQ